MALPDPEQARSWGGMTVVDRDGAMIGACTQVYVDDATGRPEWATARIGSRSVVLPLVDAVQDGDTVRVTVGRDQALLAPSPADRAHISQDEEAGLYRHYGIAFSREGSGTQLPAGEAPARRVRGSGTRWSARPARSATSAAAVLRRAADDRDRLVLAMLLVLVAGTAVSAVREAVRARRRRQLRSAVTRSLVAGTTSPAKRASCWSAGPRRAPQLGHR